jgi:uncharacterized protein
LTTLLDANLLVALVVGDHVHHDAAERWFVSGDFPFATCPITEGALVRLLVREGESSQTAKALLEQLAADPRHVFWEDSIPYQEVRLEGVIGHRQVTDAYLAQLARTRSGHLATFDAGLAELHDDVAQLVHTSDSPTP